MIVSRRHLIAAAFACAAQAIFTGRAARADPLTENAQALVRSLADQGIGLLSDQTASTEQKVQHFRSLFDQYFAVDAIARWVLGRYTRDLPPAQWNEYRALFEDLVIYGYVKRFSTYSGENLQIIKTLPTGPNTATVYSQVNRPSADRPIAVDWLIGSRDGTYKITDVVIEGVSLSQTWRSDFAATIRQGGGQVSSLLETLRAKVAQLKAELAAGR